MSFSREEKDFLGSGNVIVVIPQNTTTDVHGIFQDGDHETTSTSNVLERDTLFFDEHLTVYVILRLPEAPEETLKAYLSRLNLHIEVWATDKALPTDISNTGPTRELLFSQKVKHEDDPIVLISQGDDSDAGVFLNLVWETTVILYRPRLRFTEPHVLIVPSATIAPAESGEADNDYLVPFQAASQNLLDPLKGSRGFEKEVPYFPASRIHKVLPRTPKEDHTFHLHGTPTQAKRTHMVCITRLRYSKVATHGTSLSMLTTLDIDMIPFLDLKAGIGRADMSLVNGKVVSLMDDLMPITCQSKDSISLLFRLITVKRGANKGSSAHSLSADSDNLTVTLDFVLFLTQECRPKITIEWTSNVEFFQNVNQAYANHEQTLQKSIRLPNQPSTREAVTSSELTRLRHGSDSFTQTVTISFAAPHEAVKVGIPFCWQVLVLNRSSRTAKLAIIPLPRLQRASHHGQQYVKRHVPRVSSISVRQGDDSQVINGEDIAPAFVDENIVYAMQHSGAIPADTDLLSLTPELRIGPLGAGQCHEGQIKMVAFKRGPLVVDAIRVVDLTKETESGVGSPGVITDIHDLPDIIVE